MFRCSTPSSFLDVFIEKHVFTKFHLDWLLFQRITDVPIIMYGLRLFIVNYNVYQIVYILVSSELRLPITSQSFVCLHLLISEIAKWIA